MKQCYCTPAAAFICLVVALRLNPLLSLWKNNIHNLLILSNIHIFFENSFVFYFPFLPKLPILTCESIFCQTRVLLSEIFAVLESFVGSEFRGGSVRLGLIFNILVSWFVLIEVWNAFMNVLNSKLWCLNSQRLIVSNLKSCVEIEIFKWIQISNSMKILKKKISNEVISKFS